MKYFDAHCHTNFAAYNEDRAETIYRAKNGGVVMNVVGTQRETSASAVLLAEKYENVYATIGLHPIHTGKSFHDTAELGEGGKEFTSRGEQFDISNYEKLARHPRVVAIGECGLDYYRCDESTKAVQKNAFIQQIELANKVGKPLMLHIRDPLRRVSGEASAYEDAREILKAHAKVQGDVHFFAGDWNTAKKFLDMGFTVSFTGVITFTHDYDEVVKNVPLGMILSETDAPYVSPVPHRGRRNEPSYVVEVIRAIARVRGEDFEKVSAQIFANAGRVFGVK